MLRELKNIWKNYRFRFTPWQAFNFGRLAVPIENQVQSLEISDELLCLELQQLLRDFRPPDYVWMFRNSPERQREFRLCSDENRSGLFRAWGFELGLRASGIKGAGLGVFVLKGSVRKGQIVALYPGTVYRPSQPIL